MPLCILLCSMGTSARTLWHPLICWLGVVFLKGFINSAHFFLFLLNEWHIVRKIGCHKDNPHLFEGYRSIRSIPTTSSGEEAKDLLPTNFFFFFNFQKMRSRWFWGRRCIFVFLKGQYHVFPLVTSFQGPADGCLQSLCLHLNKSVLGHLAHCFFSSEVRFFVLCPAKAP